MRRGRGCPSALRVRRRIFFFSGSGTDSGTVLTRSFFRFSSGVVLLSVFLLLLLDNGGGGALTWCRRRYGFFRFGFDAGGCLQGEKVEGWVIGAGCFVLYSPAALVWWWWLRI